MIPVNSNFKGDKNKLINQPVFLYTIFEYDGVNDLNLAESKENVIYDGVTYLAFPIKHDTIGENSQGEIDSIKISVSNVSRLIQYYLEAYDFGGKKVRIRMIFREHLNDPDACLDYVYFIDSYSANQDVAEFTLLPKTNVLSLTIPARNYSRNYCQWIFKDPDTCQYSGEGATCNKTKQACKGYGNYINFGGFPSIPTTQIYV